MSDDIVGRLQRIAWEVDYLDAPPDTAERCREAADEIIRLRAVEKERDALRERVRELEAGGKIIGYATAALNETCAAWKVEEARKRDRDANAWWKDYVVPLYAAPPKQPEAQAVPDTQQAPK